MPHPASRVHFRIRAYIRPARGRDPASQPKTCNLHLLSICGLPGITRPKHTRVVGNLGGDTYSRGQTSANIHTPARADGTGEGREGCLGSGGGTGDGGLEGRRKKKEKRVLTAGGVATFPSSLCGGGGEEVTSGEFLHTGHGGERLVPANLNRGAGYMRM